MIAPKNCVTFVSFSEMASKTPDDRASHYRYRKEGNDRKRHKEKGRLFALDADEDDPAEWPSVRAGSWVIDLYLQKKDSEGQPVTNSAGDPEVVPVDFIPGQPAFYVRVDVAGRPPISESASLTARDVQLSDLQALHHMNMELRALSLRQTKRVIKEADRQRKKKKKWRKRAQEAEDGSLFGQLLKGARDNPQGTIKVLKEGAPLVAEVVKEVYDHIKESRKDAPIDVNDGAGIKDR